VKRPGYSHRQHDDRPPGRHVRPGAALPDPGPGGPVQDAGLLLSDHEARAPLTPQAMKRLRLLGSLDSLGAGFNLASHDLDLRGAGNLLGEEQSGHIKEVGYELYQQMLEETIAKIKSGELQGLTTSTMTWAPQMNLGVPVMIPETMSPTLTCGWGCTAGCPA
jgi:hypothetical protein